MNILIICPNWVGDAVMATPTFRALRRGFSKARIVGLLRPLITELLQDLQYFDEVVRWRPRSEESARRAWPGISPRRRQRFDLAVLLTNSCHSAVVAWLAGARRRVGYARDGRSWLLTDRLKPLRAGRHYLPSPMIDYYLSLAEHLGCPRQTTRMELRTVP